MTPTATRHLIAALAVAVLAPAAALALVTYAPASGHAVIRQAATTPADLAEFEVRDEFIAAMKAQKCETDMQCVAQCLPTARTAAEREFCFSF